MVGNGCIPDRVNNLCFIHPGLPYLQSKMSTNQTTPTTPPRCREGRGQMRKEQAMPANLRPCSLGARGHPLDHQSGLHFAWTQATLAQISALESATRRQPTQIRSPSGLHWRPQYQSDLQTVLPPWKELPPVKMVHPHHPVPDLEQV
jgi:hypothetical protein